MKIGLFVSYNNVGYAVIENNNNIIEAGVNNIKVTSDEKNEFIKGKSISTNPNRTLKRQARVCMQRYKARRRELYDYLDKLNYLPNNDIDDKELWRLRSISPTQMISLQELGAVLIHIAKKRGYKPTGDKFNENSDYLANLESNTKTLHDSKLTIGQYLYNRYFQGLRIKEILFKREDYEYEFWAIINKQMEYHNNLTIETANDLFNIIYYQRPLKSQKHRVSKCKYTGYRVAHKSNPYFQEFKILTGIENVVVYDAYGRNIPIDEDKLQDLYSNLMVSKKLTATQILKLFGYKATTDKVAINYDKGLSGNITFSEIKKIIPDYNPTFDELYALWHLLYSVEDNSKSNILRNKYNFNEDQIEQLCNINFGKEGYCNLSEKAIKALLPHLRNKKNLSDSIKLAKLKVISNDIDTTTKTIPLFKNNHFLNIVLEKAANKTVNLLNEIISKYSINECVIEFDPLVLKSNEARKNAIKRKRMNIVEESNIRKDLFDSYGLENLTKKDLIKYRLWNEFGGYSPYEPTTQISLTELFDKNTNDPFAIEHIIPISRLFDNSLNNKTICRRSINNISKDDMTANEYMITLDKDLYDSYLKLIENAKISYTKKKRLLAMGADVDTNYISSTLDFKHKLAKDLKNAINNNGIDVKFSNYIISDHLKNIWDLRNEDVSDEADDDIRLLALNAIIAGFTSELIINQLDNLNKNYIEAKNNKISLRKFGMPFENFTNIVKSNVRSVIPKYKIGSRLYSKDKNGHANPRIQLHKETIYGMNKKYLIDKNGKRAETYEAVVKYPLATITEKDIGYIVDSKIREIVRNRLIQYGNNSAKCWDKLTENPLYDFNGKIIRSIRLWTGLKKVRPLHYINGKWNDYVLEGNLHHAGIYLDNKGKLQFKEVSGLTAIMRVNIGMDIIITKPLSAYEQLHNYKGKIKIDDVFNEQLPEVDWSYVIHFQKGMLLTLNDETWRIHSFSAGRLTLMKPHHSDIADRNKMNIISYRNVIKTLVEDGKLKLNDIGGLYEVA